MELIPGPHPPTSLENTNSRLEEGGSGIAVTTAKWIRTKKNGPSSEWGSAVSKSLVSYEDLLVQASQMKYYISHGFKLFPSELTDMPVNTNRLNKQTVVEGR